MTILSDDPKPTPDEGLTPPPATSPEAPGTIPVPGLTSQPPEGDLGGLKPGTEEFWPSGRKKYPSEKRRKAKKGKTPLQEPLEGLQAPPAPGQSPEEKAQLSAALEMGFAFGAKAFAAARGKHWELEAQEATDLGQAWAEVLAPYLGAMGKAAPWVTAVMVTAGVVVPRVVADSARVDTAGKPVKPAPRQAEPDVSGEVVKDEEVETVPAPQHPPTAGGGPILPPPNLPKAKGKK